MGECKRRAAYRAKQAEAVEALKAKRSAAAKKGAETKLKNKQNAA